MSGVDLVTFLRARLDEREAAAKAANPSPWRRITNQEPRLSSTTIFGASYPGDQEKLRNVCNVELSWKRDANATHIALNDPQFLLDDVAAKRRIVDAAFRHLAVIDGEWGCCHSAEAIAAGRCPENSPDQSEIIRLLAAPFAQHPDFDPAWAVPGEQS